MEGAGRGGQHRTGDQMGDSVSKADDIRAVMSGLDAKYRQLEHQRRDLDGKLDGVRMALDESVQQLREAIGRNDMREA